MMCIVFAVLFSCKKENDVNNSSGQMQWMHVLTDTITSSTDDELYQGENGKVVTNSDDEIFLYYYVRERKQTVVMKCNANGITVWKKVFGNFVPCDMVLLNNGSIVISGTLPDKSINSWNKLYAIRPAGNIDSIYFSPAYYFNMKSSINSTLYALPDNSIIFSGAFDALNAPPSHYPSFVKISPSFTIEWRTNIYTGFNIPPPIYFGQNSIIQTNNNQFLFQFAQSVPENYVDSCYFSLKTGLLNANGSIAYLKENPTGYFITSTGQKSGTQNRYCNGLMHDGNGDIIYHYSSPRIFGNASPKIPAGFLRIGSDASIKDTIPIPLPNGYRIVSCVQNNGRFLMTAYKTGGMQGANDFSAGHTLFLTGGSDWQTTNTFTFQNFYADFFTSAAPTSDGGFIIMGKIQSFNGPSNKLVLIKWRS